MQKIFFLLMILTSSCFSQNGNEPYKVRLKNNKLIEIVNLYVEVHELGNEKGVLTLEMMNNGEKSTFVVGSIINKSVLKNHPCNNYSYIKGIPILIYSGIEKEIEVSQELLFYLNQIVHPFLYNDLAKPKNDDLEDEFVLINIPPSYNAQVWKIEFKNGKLINEDHYAEHLYDIE